MNKRRHKNIMRARLYLARRDIRETLKFVDDILPKQFKDYFDKVTNDWLNNIGWAEIIEEELQLHKSIDLFKPNKVTLNKN